MSWFESLFETQIQSVVKSEGEILEKALRGGKALADYIFDRLHVGSMTISFNFPKVSKAEPIKPE